MRSHNRYRLENSDPAVAAPAPATDETFDPAVAAPAAQVQLRHAREVYRCTLFGTSQAWDIPDALRGLQRTSVAFRAWYVGGSWEHRGLQVHQADEGPVSPVQETVQGP